jgi:hypothetical protein
MMAVVLMVVVRGLQALLPGVTGSSHQSQEQQHTTLAAVAMGTPVDLPLVALEVVG